MPTGRVQVFRPRRKGPRPQLGEPAPDLSWSGRLERTAEGIAGTLEDQHGWVLVLAGVDQPGGGLVVRATVCRHGVDLPPWNDTGLRVALTDQAGIELSGRLARSGRMWAGSLDDAGGPRVTIEAEPEAPGKLVLRGAG